MAKKSKYHNKFIVAFDTICDGEQCWNDENDKPCLHNSHDEAFVEMFDSALSMLSNRSAFELKEYNEGVTKKMVGQMKEIYNSKDVKAMKDFWNKYPQVNDLETFVVSAEEFILGRKAIFTGEGLVIEGTKLK